MGQVFRLIELARVLGKAKDPLVRQDLAALYSRFRLADLTGARGLARQSRGGIPGPELSMAKLNRTNNWQFLSHVASNLIGIELTVETSDPLISAWTRLVLESPGMRIAGGTDEIQRNILSERVLGLHKEPRKE